MYVPLQFYTKGSVKLDSPYAAGAEGSSASRLSFICGPVSTLEYCAHHFIFGILYSDKDIKKEKKKRVGIFKLWTKNYIL